MCFGTFHPLKFNGRSSINPVYFTNPTSRMYTATASPFGRASSFAGAYRQIGVETGVSGASPHQLVTMLFDGFVDTVAEARGALERRDFAGKGRAVNRALAILQDGLKAGLDLQAGGKLAADLYALYAYIATNLNRAHMNNDDAQLGQCQQLIEPVRQAWKTIGPQVNAQGR